MLPQVMSWATDSQMTKLRSWVSGRLCVIRVFCGLRPRPSGCHEGQVERERCAFAGAFACRGQRAAHFVRRERATVQAEAVAAGGGAEAVRKNLRQVAGLDAAARVLHAEPQARIRGFDRDDEFARLRVGASDSVARV